jgi:hypothetical protein
VQETINAILTNPTFQIGAAAALTIVFKALWNAVRDQARAIELSDDQNAKQLVKFARKWRKPISRLVIDLTRAWIETLETDKPFKRIVRDTVLNLLNKK